MSVIHGIFCVWQYGWRGTTCVRLSGHCDLASITALLFFLYTINYFERPAASTTIMDVIMNDAPPLYGDVLARANANANAAATRRAKQYTGRIANEINRIAAAKSRVGQPRPHTPSNVPNSNVFGSSAPQPLTSASTNGFTFGGNSTPNVFGASNQQQSQPQQPAASASVNGFTFGGNNNFPSGITAPGGAFTFASQDVASNNPFVTDPAFGRKSKAGYEKARANAGLSAQPPPPSFGGNIFNLNPPNGNNGPETSGDQDMMTDSPEKKTFAQSSTFSQPAPSQPQFSFGSNNNPPVQQQQNGGLFGSSQMNGQTNQSGGGLFGSVAQAPGSQQGNSVFSSTQSSRHGSQEPPQFIPFGQSQQAQPQQSGNLFGLQSQAPQPPSMFGQTQSAPSSFSQSIQPQQTEQQQPQSQSFGLFGQQSAPQPAHTPSFTAFGKQDTEQRRSTSPFAFGQSTQAQQQEQSQPPAVAMFGSQQQEQQTPGGLFGRVTTPDQSQQPQQQEQQQPSGGLFGRITKAVEPQQQEAQQTPFQFGQNNGNTQPNNVFNIGSTMSAPQPSSTVFSFGQSQTQPSAQPSNVFGGFGIQRPEESQQNSYVSDQNTPAPQPAAEVTQPKPTFVFGQTSGAEASKPTEQHQQPNTSGGPFAGLFNQNRNSQTQPAVAETHITQISASDFAPTSTSTATSNPFQAVKPAAPTSSFGGAFGGVQKRPQEPPAQDEPANQPETSAPAAKSGFTFGSSKAPSSGGLFTPAPPRQADQPQAPQTEPKKAPLFGQGSNLQSAQPAPATEKPKKRLFGQTLDSSSTPSQAPKKKRSNPFDVSSHEAEDSPVPSEEASALTTTSALDKRIATPKAPSRSRPATAKPLPAAKAVYATSSAHIPRYLNDKGYIEYEKNSKVRGLNRGFQSMVAGVDTNTKDFEALIRHYVTSRESIGADIGLYQRHLASKKRKHIVDEDEEEENVPPQYKRSRTDEKGTSRSVVPEPPTSNHNTSSASSQAVSASTSNAISASYSKAAGLFANMVPKSPEKPRARSPPKDAEKPASVFGSVPATKTASNNIFAAKPAPTATPTAQSTNIFASAMKPAQTFTPQVQSQTSNVFAQVPATAPAKTQAAPSTTPVKSPPKKAEGFKPAVSGFKPNAASTSTGGNLFASFAQAAEASKNKRTAEQMLDYDSDEDSQAEGLKELAERERAKKAKYESVAKTGFTPMFTPTTASSQPTSSFGPSSFGTSTTKQVKTSPAKAQSSNPFEPDSSSSSGAEDIQDDEAADTVEDRDYQPEQDGSDDSEGDDDHGGSSRASANGETTGEEDLDHDDEIANNPNAGKSLFERITPSINAPEQDNEANGERSPSPGAGYNFGEAIRNSTSRNAAFKPAIWGSEIGKETPEAPEYSPITPFGSSKSPYKPATTFNFNPTTTTPTPVNGNSVLLGATFNADASKFEGMFGSRPTTPDPGNASTPAPAEAVGDHTWKVGTPIKFGSAEKSADAPAINITDASPSNNATTPKPFGSLFGTPAPATKDSVPTMGFSFGAKPAPGFLGATPHLAADSGANSGLSSRATSPGLTDNDSVATNTDNETEVVEAHPQVSLMASRAGEEEEDCVFEGKSKALRFISVAEAKETRLPENSWSTCGTGQLRVLKHKVTGKTRMLFRIEPSANVLINQFLLPNFQWELQDNGEGKSASVKGAFITEGKLQRYVFKVKNSEIGQRLKEALEEGRSHNK